MGAHFYFDFKRLFSKLEHAPCNWGFFTVPVLGLAFNGCSINWGIAVAVSVSERCANSLFAHILNAISVVASGLFKFLVGLFGLSVSRRSRYHGRCLICAVGRNLALLRPLLRCLLLSWSETRRLGSELNLCGILFFTSSQKHSVRILTLGISHKFLVVTGCPWVR